MKLTKKYLLEKQWSMGNGQCPECYGVPESWLGHPLYLNSSNIGHKKDCKLANMLIENGCKPLFIGKSKLKTEYECYITKNGIFSTRLKTKNGCPILKKENDELRNKLDEILLNALLKSTGDSDERKK